MTAVAAAMASPRPHRPSQWRRASSIGSKGSLRFTPIPSGYIFLGPTLGGQIVGPPTIIETMAERNPLHVPDHPWLFVTAASLFDGHDASINIMRRILQSQGAEVIHLGHNRSVDEVLVACLQEDVQGVAVSSYQGGHVEYFKYLVDQLKARGAGNVKVYGGGGGTIVRSEIAELQAHGVEKIFSPEDGQRLGPAGMINPTIVTSHVDPRQYD